MTFLVFLFIDQESEGQKDKVTCPRPWSWYVTELWFQPSTIFAFCKRELEMKYGRELARGKGNTEQESEEERKVPSIPGCNDYICFLLPHNTLPQTLLLKIAYIYYLIVSIGQSPGIILLGSLLQGFSRLQSRSWQKLWSLIIGSTGDGSASRFLRHWQNSYPVVAVLKSCFLPVGQGPLWAPRGCPQDPATGPYPWAH